MASNLRNFRLDDESWNAFIEQCKADRTTASAELAHFVKAYLGGVRLSKEDVETSLTDRLNALTVTVEDLRGKLTA